MQMIPEPNVRETTEFESTDCPLCGASAARTLFVAADRLIGRPGEFPVVRCDGCGLVFLRPRPAPWRLGDFYPDEYYPLSYEPSAEGHAVAGYLLAMVLGWTREQNLREPSLLDIGCGTGLFLNLARQAGMRVQGIEMSPSAAAYARGKYDLEVHCGTIEDAGLAGCSFDIITMWQVLEHLPQPVAALRQAARALRSGGVLLLTVPNFESIEAHFFGHRWYSLDAPRHLYQFTPSTIARALNTAGLKPVRVTHSKGTAGLVYSLMGDLTGVSLRVLGHPLANSGYRRVAGVLHRITVPACAAAARFQSGGALEVYAVKP